MQAEPAGIGGPYGAPDVLELGGGDNVESANADSKIWITVSHTFISGYMGCHGFGSCSHADVMLLLGNRKDPLPKGKVLPHLVLTPQLV